MLYNVHFTMKYFVTHLKKWLWELWKSISNNDFKIVLNYNRGLCDDSKWRAQNGISWNIFVIYHKVNKSQWLTLNLIFMDIVHQTPNVFNIKNYFSTYVLTLRYECLPKRKPCHWKQLFSKMWHWYGWRIIYFERQYGCWGPVTMQWCNQNGL